MWLIYYKRTGVVFTNGYHRGWYSRSDALEWAKKERYGMDEIEVVPAIDITE
jgi:hypothetical protein